jgi:hypothetical protein
VTFANRTGVTLDSLVFRTYPNAARIYGGELAVASARVGGQPVATEVFLEDETAVRLPLAAPLDPGEAVQVELDFTGRVPSDLEARQGVYGIFNFDPQAQVLTLANWYPILAPWRAGAWQAGPVVGIGDAVVSDAALYRVEVAAPPGWQVIATGSRAGPESGGQDPAVTFASGPAREFTLVAGPNFELLEEAAGGVRLRHWGLPGGEARWEEALAVAAEALQLFGDRFGPYPYAELDVVAAPLRLASGVEYPGLILLGENLYQAAPAGLPAGPGSPAYLAIVASHEVAHQWWYAVVGNDVLADPWQDEALATFSSLLYLQARQPQVYRGALEAYADRVASAERDLAETGVGQPVEAFANAPGAYSPVVYQKGALFFVALREQIGEEAFFAGLRSYYAENRYHRPQPAVLLAAFETACACQLDEFYAEWGVE